MRVGEACGLDRSDVDTGTGVVTIRAGKLGKAREVPLHPTASQALAAYGRRRDQLCPRRATPAFFVNVRGTRLAARRVPEASPSCAGPPGSAPCPVAAIPALHDLRHSFTVATLLDWYRAGPTSTPGCRCCPPTWDTSTRLDLLVSAGRPRTARPGRRPAGGSPGRPAMSALAPILQGFFTDRLVRQRQASDHTITAYRNTIRLLLRFAWQQTGRQPASAHPRRPGRPADRRVPASPGDRAGATA